VKKTITVIVLALAFIPLAFGQEAGVEEQGVQTVSIAEGWASNSINAVIFRRNSVVSHEDIQYVAFYDPNATVVLAKRRLGTPDWEIRRTPYKGSVADAHNSISIMADHDGEGWNAVQVSQRSTPFSLSGGGTKRIPISRPQIVADPNGTTDRAYMLFRDIERDDRVSLAICEDLRLGEWRFIDLTDYSVSQWEPSYDTELWARSKLLHVFVQKVDQGDGETLMPLSPQPVSILEWRPES